MNECMKGSVKREWTSILPSSCSKFIKDDYGVVIRHVPSYYKLGLILATRGEQDSRGHDGDFQKTMTHTAGESDGRRTETGPDFDADIGSWVFHPVKSLRCDRTRSRHEECASHSNQPAVCRIRNERYQCLPSCDAGRRQSRTYSYRIPTSQVSAVCDGHIHPTSDRPASRLA